MVRQRSISPSSNNKVRTRKARSRWFTGQVEQLEARFLLAPVLDPTLTGLFSQPQSLVSLTNPVFGVDSDGNGSIGAGETPTSLRIEASPRGGAFNGDLFAVARGPWEDTNNNGRLDAGEDLNGNGVVGTTTGLDRIAGRIYRVNANTGAVSFFNSVPGGGDLAFGGYTEWFDIAFDPVGIFSDHQPAVYVSTVDDAPLVPGIGAPRNAIYRFKPSGAPIDFRDANSNGAFDLGEAIIPFAMFTLDVNFDGKPDDVPAVLAFSPSSTANPFATPPALYVGDVKVGGPTDGNTFFAITSSVSLPPITDTSKTRLVIGSEDINGDGVFQPATEDLNGNGVFDTSSPPGVLINSKMETRFTAGGVAAPLPDIDMRGFAFDPGSSSSLYDGDLYGVSTDLEDDLPAGAVSARFTPPAATLGAELFLPFSEPLDVHHWSDITFDPVGFLSAGVGGAFAGSVFEADMRSSLAPQHGSVYRLAADGTFNDAQPFLTGFHVPETDTTINPTGGLEQAFSISLTPDGTRLFISDLDAIWFVDPHTTLPQSEIGAIIGLTDLRTLGIPYRGAGLAVAILDTGVDASHGGFNGHATQGINILFGGPGTFDVVGHGTSVAGIVSQLVPDATIVPIQLFTSTAGFSQQNVWNGIKFVADNPTVIDPVTGKLSKIVAGNMSFGDVIGNFSTELDASKPLFSLVGTLKFQFLRWLKEGITPVGAAGNEGISDPLGLSGARVPGILREVTQVIATYPYPFDVALSMSPLDTPQGFASASLPQGIPAGCALEAGDLEVFADKVTAFSSRSWFSDLAAPGTCQRTFFSSFAPRTPLQGPIELRFNGTSSAAPTIAGEVALTRSAVDFWSAIFAAASCSTDPYLIGPAGAAAVCLPGIRNLAAYANPNGINSILEWTAVPILDVDFPDGSDNDVVHQAQVLHPNGCDLFSSTCPKFRTYARADVGNAVAAIEGSMALDFLAPGKSRRSVSPRVAALDLNHDGNVTAQEIESFISTPAGSLVLPPGVTVADVPAIKAAARLLGGTDSGARLRRMKFFDFAADGVIVNPSTPAIAVNQFATLKKNLLPKPNDFPITNRNTNKGFLLAPNRRRYEDLKVLRTGFFFKALKGSPGNLNDNLIAPLNDPMPATGQTASNNSPGAGASSGGGGGGGGGNALPLPVLPVAPAGGGGASGSTGSSNLLSPLTTVNSAAPQAVGGQSGGSTTAPSSAVDLTDAALSDLSAHDSVISNAVLASLL